MTDPQRITYDPATFRTAIRAALTLAAGGNPLPTETVESDEDASRRRAAATANRRARWERRLPARYAAATATGLTPDQDPGGRVSGWWGSGHQTLVLYSATPGVGKTHAAYAVGNDAVAAGATAEAWSTIALLDAMRPGPQAEPGLAAAAAAADLLVLDDLGREVDKTGWAAQQIHGILDARLANRRRTIVTTNLTDAVLAGRYSEPLLDRLVDDAVIVEVTGESRRRPARWGA